MPQSGAGPDDRGSGHGGSDDQGGDDHVDKTTSVGSVATSTWRVRLTKGTYTFKCDPHASMMRGSLRVV